MPLGTYAKSLEYYSTTKINVNMHRSIQDQTLNRNFYYLKHILLIIVPLKLQTHVPFN